MKVIFNTDNLKPNECLIINENIQQYFQDTKLELGGLQKIVVSNNYFEDVINVQKELGLTASGASNNENAKGVGYTITSRKNKDSKSIVVVNEPLISKILSSDQNEQLDGLHIIHHELVHVHDDYLKNKLYTDEERCGAGVGQLKHYLRIKADVIWGEYIAERLSASSATKCHTDTLINSFGIQASNLTSALERERIKFLKHNETNIYFDKVAETLYYFLKTNLMIIGVLDGEADKNIKKDLECELLKSIGDSDYIRIYNQMRRSLSKIYSLYPNWNSIAELDSLGNVIRDTWLWLDFRLIETEGNFEVKFMKKWLGFFN